MRGRVILDTNLLVLLIVGTTSPKIIAAHKRTRAYDSDDFRLLQGILAEAQGLLTTPTILAETSNLIRQCAPPYLPAVIRTFQAFVASATELYAPSADVVAHPAFAQLGLTDAAILAALEPKADHRDIGVLTDDFDLYLSSALAGRNVVNFTHERERWLS